MKRIFGQLLRSPEAGVSEGDSFESFESFEDGETAENIEEFNPEDEEDDWGADDEEEEADPVAKEVKKEKVDPDSQLAALDPSEKKVEVKEETPKKVEKEEGKEEKEEENSEKPAETPGEETAVESKMMKGFLGKDKVEMPEDVLIPVKIDGKNERVSIKDLRDNYSGQQSWDKKFSELTGDKKSYEAEKQQYTVEKQQTVELFQDLRKLAEGSIDGEENPMGFVSKMLDVMGLDAHKFNKNIMSHLSDELYQLNDMTESERSSYWLQKENTHLMKQQESLQSTTASEKAQRELRGRVDTLREAQGVSEDQYVSSYNELKTMGAKDLTPEKIVRYAAFAEPTSKATDLVSPYSDQLDDDGRNELIVSIAKGLFDGSASIESVKTFLAEEFDVDGIVSAIKNRNPIKKVAKKAPKKQKTEAFDTFDEF